VSEVEVEKDTAASMALKIPRVFHFVFGLNPQFSFKPFSVLHYVAVKSAILINKAEKVYVYYSYEPEGFWWNETKKW